MTIEHWWADRADNPLRELENINSELPVLIAGPTASGKSAVALEIAARHGGVIVNADALQVFANWRVLTARPSEAEESVAPHRLYGHVAGNLDYSVGQWLRDLTPLLAGPDRLIVVGGTGLYFRALTEGLADIPPTPASIRKQSETLMAEMGVGRMLAEIDAQTADRIDRANPVRVQRAWEVQQSTGRGLAAWQDETPPPLLDIAKSQTILIDADRDWLGDRIERRFDSMLANGALAEAQANMEDWNPARPSSKAIGAGELIAHLAGEMSLQDAGDQAKTATRQFAKRQRTWFRKRMQGWNRIVQPD